MCAVLDSSLDGTERQNLAAGVEWLFRRDESRFITFDLPETRFLTMSFDLFLVESESSVILAYGNRAIGPEKIPDSSDSLNSFYSDCTHVLNFYLIHDSHEQFLQFYLNDEKLGEIDFEIMKNNHVEIQIFGRFAVLEINQNKDKRKVFEFEKPVCSFKNSGVTIGGGYTEVADNVYSKFERD